MKSTTNSAVCVLLLAFAGVSLAGWSPQTSGVTSTLYDIECVGPNQVWAVGAGGKILHTTNGGTDWSPQTSGTGNDLYGVDFVDSLNGWTAGTGPTIVHTTDGGASWSPQTAGVSDDLMDIAFGSATRGWCSGVNGAIIGTTDGGTTWSREISGIWGWFWGVTAASPTAAWTIGGDWFNHVSPVYHYNGTSWSHQYDITQDQNGQDISVVNGNILWAVADNGVIAHSANGGTNWSPQSSGVGYILDGVDAVSANYCWVVGGNGTILSTASGGTTWVPETSGVSNELFGVSMLDSVSGWACGAGGRILYRAGGQAVEERRNEERRNEERGMRNSGASIVRGCLVWSARIGRNDGVVALHSAEGRKVMELRPGSNDVSGLAAGVYFVMVGTDSGSSTFRFVQVD